MIVPELSNPWILAVIIGGAALLVILFLVLFFAIRDRILTKRVEKTSPYLKNIREANAAFAFHVLPRPSETKTYHLKSKRAFDSFDPEKKKTEFVKENIAYYEQVVFSITHNQETLVEYKKALEAVKLCEDASFAKANKMSLRAYRKRETKLGNKLIKVPCTSHTLVIAWEYTSPAGRSHYELKRSYPYRAIAAVVSSLNKTRPVKETESPKRAKKPEPPKSMAPEQRIYTNDDIEDIE
ncbi:MAG: hypothetical protein HUJ60_00615 [Bacilli bacterium]|nr:hypothetical protein [Bacilli bacterium]